ncbi:MAG: hypothetical protein ABJP48_03490 [Erythrobacter sp.]
MLQSIRSTKTQDISAMKLVEEALEYEIADDQITVISGAAVPIAIRRLALELLVRVERSG